MTQESPSDLAGTLFLRAVFWVAPVAVIGYRCADRHKRIEIQLQFVDHSVMGTKRRIVDDQLYVHFITFSVYRRRRLLDHEQSKRIVLGWLNEVLNQYQAICVGFVVMPNHVHALIWFPKTGQLSSFIHSWKRRSSIALRDWYRKHSPNYFAEFCEGERFWQPKYYAFE
ncbi:MAG: transposase, partial [Planctomycetaceae bacterium]